MIDDMSIADEEQIGDDINGFNTLIQAILEDTLEGVLTVDGTLLEVPRWSLEVGQLGNFSLMPISLLVSCVRALAMETRQLLMFGAEAQIWHLKINESGCVMSVAGRSTWQVTTEMRSAVSDPDRNELLILYSLRPQWVTAVGIEISPDGNDFSLSLTFGTERAISTGF